MDFNTLKNQGLENIQAGIPELNNSSNSSIYLKMLDTFSLVLTSAYNAIDGVRLLISENLANGRIYQRRYYESTALDFQYGDNLLISDAIDGYKPYYASINETNQIIKQSSVKESFLTSQTIDGQTYLSNGSLTMNVASQDNTGALIPLTQLQLNSFNSYMENFKELGVPLNIYSNNGNLIRFSSIKILYNSNYDLSNIISETLSFVNQGVLPEYLGGIKTISGEFFIDRVMYYLDVNVEGIISANFFGGQINVPTDPNVWNSFDIKTEMSSGYFNWDTTFITQIQDPSNYESVSI
jgi:hypothetical protein